jgi:zinc protease
MGKVSLGDKEAYQVSGRVDGMRVQLWFDAQTGLLLRRRLMNSTILGTFPEQIDYEDYRDVNGVKLPFVIRNSNPDPSAAQTVTYKEIVHNVPVDEARFNPPGKK